MRKLRSVPYEISVEDYVESMENKNTKTKRDLKLLRDEKNDEREVHTIIAPEGLNKYFAEFIVLLDVMTEKIMNPQA